MSALRDAGGRADVVAGLAGGALAPLATLGDGVPAWISIPAAVAVFFGLRLALAQRGGAGTAAAEPAADAALRRAGDALGAARACIARLDASLPSLEQGPARERLARVRNVAAGIASAIESRPLAPPASASLLVGHLPAAARLAEAVAGMETSAVRDGAALDAANALAGRLDRAFAREPGREPPAAAEIEDALRGLEATARRTGHGEEAR